MKALLALTTLLLAACAAPTPPIPNDSLAAEARMKSSTPRSVPNPTPSQT
ncbi:MAG: hypothetical protein U1E77_21725 [Inhella sp.]